MNNNIAANAEYSEIEVLNQSWAGGTAYSYKMKKRPFFGICFITDGAISYKTENSEIIAESGDITVLKKDALYRAEFLAPQTKDILINFQCSSDFAADENNDITLIKGCKSLKDDFLEVLNYAAFSERGCMVKSILYRILDGITQFGAETALSAQIKQLINSEPAMSEADIAKACSISISTLQRTFRAAYGKTVSEYKNDIRMARAKKLLLSGMYSVEETAIMLNFCDCAYFSRCFKKHVGVSPKKFIKQTYIIF